MPRDGHPPYFPFYPDDFASDGDVEAMSIAQVGAYMLLLCKAWREDPVGSVPDDDRRLARWARMTPEEWSEAKPAVMVPFTLRTDGRWHQPRMQREFMKLRESSRRRAEAGTEGAKKRWGNRIRDGNAMAMPSESHGTTNAKPMRSDGKSSSSAPSVAGATPPTPKGEPSAETVELPACMERSDVRLALGDWLEHKRSMRKPYRSEKAVMKLVRQWEVRGADAFVSAVNHSIAQNYQGIYEAPGDSNGRAGGATNRESSAETRQRGNLSAIEGFVRRSSLRKGDVGADGSQENGGLHGGAVGDVARGPGGIQASDDQQSGTDDLC